MGIPLLQGRQFTERDAQGAVPVVSINQVMARRFWPQESPLGKRLVISGEPAPFEIVGVVGEVRHFGLEAKTDMEMYRTYEQASLPLSALVIRAAGDPLELVGAVRQEIKLVDADLPLYDIKTLEQRLSDSVVKRRFTLLLLSLFAAVAAGLAGVGIYGVMSYSVTQRTPEIGIRLALGAAPRDVLRLMVGQGIRLALLGVALGLGAALALTRLLTSLLYGVSATDPLTFALIAVLLLGVALLACYVPARRAAKVDPLVALRYE
jgi:predicted permease